MAREVSTIPLGPHFHEPWIFHSYFDRSSDTSMPFLHRCQSPVSFAFCILLGAYVRVSYVLFAFFAANLTFRTLKDDTPTMQIYTWYVDNEQWRNVNFYLVFFFSKAQVRLRCMLCRYAYTTWWCLCQAVLLWI